VKGIIKEVFGINEEDYTAQSIMGNIYRRKRNKNKNKNYHSRRPKMRTV
jgi:hypothetical protein